MRRMSRIISLCLPMPPLPILLQRIIFLPTNQPFCFPIQHEIRRGPVLEIQTERDLMISAALKETDFLMLGTVDWV
jgi:DNA-directed RNA polymerase subunit L